MTTLKGNQLADFRANEIGFIFQDFNLLESLTAQENIAVPLSLQGVRPKEIKQRVQKLQNVYPSLIFWKAILLRFPVDKNNGSPPHVH